MSVNNMVHSAKFTTVRVIVTIIAVGTVVSPYLADWNATHIYNPLWPPHAKFHNAQTMVMGTLLGVGAMFYAWRPDADRRAHLTTALLFAGLYWISQPFAFLFPGVAWTDPELLPAGHTLREFPLQIKGDVVIFALLALAGWLVASSAPGSAKERS